MGQMDDFEALRPYLFSIAYRMLGSAGDAEDVVQDAYLRWQQASAGIDAPKAWLATVVTRLCIDQLKSARVKRESYVGPWLPEPIATDDSPGPEASAEQADSLSLAFLVVLESLSPVERAVFLLREVFEYEYEEIAEIVGKSETNSRQIAHRAKQHIAGRRPRFEVTRERQEEMTYRFLAACGTGDMDGLMELLTDEVVLQSDGGGRVAAARKPIAGRARVARFLLWAVAKSTHLTTQIVNVNGQPAIGLYEGGHPTTIMTLDVAGEGIQGVHIVANPEKLTRV